MSRPHEEPVVARHIEIYASDWEFLQREFGRGSEAKLGVSMAIRKIVRKGVRAYRERLAQRAEGAGSAGSEARARGRPERSPSPSLDKFFTKGTPSDAK